MKNIKFSLFIILGLFIFNPLSGQEITSYSGAFHRISKYPSSSSGVSESYYAHSRITVSNPENIGTIRFEYRYYNQVHKFKIIDFNTVDGKTFYEIDGISREVKHTGVVLDMDISDEFYGNWGFTGSTQNNMYIKISNKTGSQIAGSRISSCVFHTY